MFSYRIFYFLSDWKIEKRDHPTNDGTEIPYVINIQIAYTER